MTNLSDNIDMLTGAGGPQYLIFQLHEGASGSYVVQGPLSEEDAETVFTTIQAAHPENVYGLVRHDDTYTVIEDATYPEPDPEPDPDPDPEPDPEGTHIVWKDSKTGEFVTPEYAAEHPDTTMSEEVPD